MRKVTVKRDKLVTPTLPPKNSDRSPDMPFEQGAHDELDPDLRHRMISEAAYYLCTQRGCADGYDMDDWLQAEEQIDHVLLNPGRGNGPRVDRS